MISCTMDMCSDILSTVIKLLMCNGNGLSAVLGGSGDLSFTSEDNVFNNIIFIIYIAHISHVSIGHSA